MRRFLLFAPVIAVWLVSAQFGLMVLGSIRMWLVREVIQPHDTYFVIYHTSLSMFLPAVAIGLTIGCLFAAAHLAFHPARTAEESAGILMRNLLKSGVVVAILIALCQGTLLFIANQQAHRRYHAYSPEITWMNWIGLTQPFFIFAALLWALRRTFVGRPIQHQ